MLHCVENCWTEFLRTTAFWAAVVSNAAWRSQLSSPPSATNSHAVSPTLSKPGIGKGLFEAVKFIGAKASGYPSWPGVTDSTEGRIHWRGPTAIPRFSLATLRRSIHSDKAYRAFSRNKELIGGTLVASLSAHQFLQFLGVSSTLQRDLGSCSV
jgi:hypothetical protein